MIVRPSVRVPVPPAVSLLTARQFPAVVQRAVGEGAEAARLYAACRGPQYAEARQRLEARIAAANRVLAAHNPGLIIGWVDLPNATRRSSR
ncbi:hypothetical protein [Streptomyces ziwulingensis]|uniref:Uncharacterized protein n=1 Tax=Streptomyces ziwulingensis TaxID=1045501 RepID=A0ABP9D7C3_9ACTN